MCLGLPDNYENQNLPWLQSKQDEVGLIILKASEEELTGHYLVKCLPDK